MEEKIVIHLTKDEALVLFEFLARFRPLQENFLEIFEDQGEQRVLWDLECLLEKQLAEPFRPDYLDLIKQARHRVRDAKN